MRSSTEAAMERIAGISPRLEARLAGAFYLLTILAGSVALFARGRSGAVAGLVAGLAWLTFLSPPLARQLSPFNMAAGVFGETSLTLWLLFRGIDLPRWRDQAALAG